MRINSAPEVLLPSKLTLEKVESAKKYIERKYSNFIEEVKLWQTQTHNLEHKMSKLGLTQGQRSEMHMVVAKQRTDELRKRRFKLSIDDYQQLQIIGRGSFGEVRLCRDRQTRELVAIKRLKKSQMIRRNQISHVKLQREVMAAAPSDYIVELKCSFHDRTYLYFVMEYLPGGDYMGLLISRDILTQSQARFYMVQLVLAVEEVHRQGYIHRDLKPDNMLIGQNGYIKLTDFGLVRYDSQRDLCSQLGGSLSKLRASRKDLYHELRKRNYSKVGTPEYIAPEVFESDGYDQAIDWWSVGIIFYESLFGFTPFADEQPKDVCERIMNWNEWIDVPSQPKISLEALSLLQGLLSIHSMRIRVDEIKSHPFFETVDWNAARVMTPPFVPLLSSQTDTSYFGSFEEMELWQPDCKLSEKKDYNFAVFNFRRSSKERNNTEQMVEQKLSEMASRHYHNQRIKTSEFNGSNRSHKKSYHGSKLKKLKQKGLPRTIRQSYNPPTANVCSPHPTKNQIAHTRLSICSKPYGKASEDSKQNMPTKPKITRIRTTHS